MQNYICNLFSLENPGNGWYNLVDEKKASTWPRPRSSAILVPLASSEPEKNCRLMLIGGSSGQEPESTHFSTLHTGAHIFEVNVESVLTMERKPVAIKPAVGENGDCAIKKSVMAAIKGDEIPISDNGVKAGRKRSASPSTLEALSNPTSEVDASKRVRCGAEN